MDHQLEGELLETRTHQNGSTLGVEMNKKDDGVNLLCGKMSSSLRQIQIAKTKTS